MTLEDPNQLDMALRANNGQIVLLIVDAGETSDEQSRFDKFLAKLKTYTNYVMSDECRKENPGVTTKDVLIYVMCATPPTEAMKLVQNVGPSGDRVNRIQVRFTTKDRLVEDLPQ